MLKKFMCFFGPLTTTDADGITVSSVLIQGRENSININFLVRISRGHS